MAWLWNCFVALNIVSFAFVVQATNVRFEKKTLKIGGRTLTVEIAESNAQHERGLMFRKTLKDNEGMLFIFPDEEIRSFWMKNTFVDLAIGYFDKNKKLVDIQEMKAVTSVMEERPPSYPSARPAKYALEVPKGWFSRHKIRKGATFLLD